MTFVIAEAGICHNGDLGQAMLLANAAKECGADAVKYQMFNSQRLWGDSRIAHLELDEAEMANVAWHCKAIGIEFMCTAFGVPEVGFLAPLVQRMKVASGCLERWDLLKAVRATKLPVILSTGMATIERTNAALNALGYYDPGTDPQPFSLLHCTSAYPCPVAEVNLAAMEVLRHHHGHRCAVGYSDHTAGIIVALAAVARGATVLEKHLTLDRQAEGPDHKASIEPKEFRIMVDAIRTVEAAVGTPEKRLQASEAAVAKAWYG